MNDSTKNVHRRALFPGTFDPITKGHEDLVARASRLFDHVILAVAQSAGKAPMFSIEERIALAQDVLGAYPNVSVIGFRKLLVQCLEEQDATVIVRGVRGVADFEYEYQLATMNHKLDKRVETIFLTPSPEYASVSSSLVREIAKLDGDVAQFVDGRVLAAINSKVGTGV